MEVRRHRLLQQRPLLICRNDFEFLPIGRTFEYALAQSLFTHLPLASIHRCLSQAARVLRPGGQLYATFFEDPRPASLSAQPLEHACADGSQLLTHHDRDPYHYPAAALAQVSQEAGLRHRHVGDWGHPRHQQMLQLCKADESDA